MTDQKNPGDIMATIDKLGLTVTAVFVPFSQSHNSKEKFPSLNWKITLLKDGREILSTDYMSGSAHAPSYKVTPPSEQRVRVAWECEHGRHSTGVMWSHSPLVRGSTTPIVPDTAGMIWCLVQDSNVIDAGGFEDWASDCGYDTDSRKAEAIYRTCLETALKLRAAIGEEGLAALRNVFKGY